MIETLERPALPELDIRRPRTVTIHVTQDDIDKGCRRSSEKCVVARAVRRAGFESVSVGPQTMCLGIGNEAVVLPRIAQKAIDAFDSQRHVAPFSFEIIVR